MWLISMTYARGNERALVGGVKTAAPGVTYSLYTFTTVKEDIKIDLL